jgi:trigger factor
LPTITEHQNEHLNVKVEHCPECIAKLEIEVAPIAATAAYSHALKAVKREISIPGFRKGKAPDDIIKTKFASAIDQEWKSTLLRNAVNEAIKLVEITPLSENSIKRAHLDKASLEEPSKIKIEVECQPAVPEIDLTALTLNEPEAPMASIDEDISAAFKSIQLDHASWKDVEPRPTQLGDYVEIDMSMPDKSDEKIFENKRVHLTEENLASWLLTPTLNKAVGEPFEATYEKPESEGEDASKETCIITIKAIKEPELPALDDELAKLCQQETFEQLRANVAKQVEYQRSSQQQQGYRQQLREQLLEKYVFELPRSLQSIDLPTEDQRLWLIAEELAKKNSLTINQQEFSMAIMSYQYRLHSMGSQPPSGPDEQRKLETVIYMNLLTQKALDFLVSAIKTR